MRTLTQPHLPTLPNPAFAGKTGNGDWADMLAEMDHNVGQMLDAVDRLGIRDNTIVIFASDNGPEFIKPWDGWAGPWRGQYFTAWEGGIRVPFMIRWPGKMPAGRVSDEIVHGVDLFPTLAKHRRRRRAEGSPDRRRRSVELLSGQDREVEPRRDSDLVRGPPAGGEVAQFQSALLSAGDDVLAAVKLGIPLLFNLYTNPREDEDKVITDSWVIRPGAEDGRRIRSERERVSADRDGHARSVLPAEVTTREISREAQMILYPLSRSDCVDPDDAVFGACSIAVRSEAASGGVAPSRRRRSRAKSAPTCKELTPDFPRPVAAPARRAECAARSCSDDIGFGHASTFGGAAATPDARPACRERAALQPLPHHGAVLARRARRCSTGRNHHSVGTGVIIEMGTGYPGYTGIVPKTHRRACRRCCG